MTEQDPRQPQRLDGTSYAEAPATEDEKADAIAALAVIAVAVLAAVHFVYTGGLPAFLGQIL